MFNISPDPQATPITPKQAAFLSVLISRKGGKVELLAAKRRAGIPIETTILRLSKWQASRLITELKGDGNDARYHQ